VMLREDGAVRLVDFDQAGNGDRFYDLAAFSLEFCSFDDEVEALVEAYLGRRDCQAIARMHLYRMIDDLVWGCWALIAQARSPRANKIEFYKYAQNRLLRCQYWLGIREFDTLLRQL
jgi:thiamine kinase-like enzyme